MIGQRAQDQTAVLFFATNMTILRRRMRARPIEAYTQYEYGAVLLARGWPGDGSKAETLLSQAIGAATELGMAKIVADAQLLMRHREFGGGAANQTS